MSNAFTTVGLDLSAEYNNTDEFLKQQPSFKYLSSHNNSEKEITLITPAVAGELDAEAVAGELDNDRFVFVGKKTGKIHLCLPYASSDPKFLKFETPNNPEEEVWNFYQIENSEFNKLTNKELSISQDELSQADTMSAAGADFIWEWACGDTPTRNSMLPISLTCLPFASCIVGAVIYSLTHYKKQIDLRGNDPETRKEIARETAKLAAKRTFINFAVMGFWELGYYIPTLLSFAFSITPFGAWLPLAVAIGAGFMQGAAAMTVKIAQDPKSSAWDCFVVFATNFLSGTAWQLCSMIPFGPLLVNTVLKPVGQLVLGTFFKGLVAGASTGFWGWLSYKLTAKNSTAKMLSDMKEQEPEASTKTSSPTSSLPSSLSGKSSDNGSSPANSPASSPSSDNVEDQEKQALLKKEEEKGEGEPERPHSPLDSHY